MVIPEREVPGISYADVREPFYIGNTKKLLTFCLGLRGIIFMIPGALATPGDECSEQKCVRAQN